MSLTVAGPRRILTGFQQLGPFTPSIVARTVSPERRYAQVIDMLYV